MEPLKQTLPEQNRPEDMPPQSVPTQNTPQQNPPDQKVPEENGSIFKEPAPKKKKKKRKPLLVTSLVIFIILLAVVAVVGSWRWQIYKVGQVTTQKEDAERKTAELQTQKGDTEKAVADLQKELDDLKKATAAKEAANDKKAKATAKANANPLVYINNQEGFQLTFPSSWKDYGVSESLADDKKSKYIYFGLPSSKPDKIYDFGFGRNYANLFAISVMDKATWTASKNDPGSGQKIGEVGDKVYTYSQGNGVAPELSSGSAVTAIKEISSIIKTFKTN